MLPYWNSDLDLEIASWFPLGVDYRPVSSSQHPRLRRIASRCLGLGSEFLFMSSPMEGCSGSLMRDSWAAPDEIIRLGFMMVLGYSQGMERMVELALDGMKRQGDGEDLSAGVASCSLWHEGTLMGVVKVIALVSGEPFFDEDGFLDGFDKTLSESGVEAGLDSDLSFFAERFGYRRFSLSYETEDPLQLRISQLLYEMEFSETRQMVGPSPEVDFPPFIGVMIGGINGASAFSE